MSDNLSETRSENLEQSKAPSRTTQLSSRVRSPRTIISFVLAAAFIFFIFRNLDLNISDIASNIASGHPGWLALGFAVYYGAFPVRAWRWRTLMKNAGIHDGSDESSYAIRSLSEIFVLSWFANCLVPAKLGDAYRGYLMRERAGVSFASTLGTIVAERFIDVLALVGIMVTAALLAFHGDIPDDVRLPLIGGVILAVAGLSGLLVVARYRGAVLRFIPERFSAPFARLQDGVLSSFARRGWLPVIVATSIIWASEGIRLYCVAMAFNVDLSTSEAMVVALLASLLTVVPLTPAGLGVVESGAIVALRLIDVSSTNAATIALVDRGIAYWSVIVVGVALTIVVRRRQETQIANRN